jgi:hypothetical protein
MREGPTFNNRIVRGADQQRSVGGNVAAICALSIAVLLLLSVLCSCAPSAPTIAPETPTPSPTSPALTATPEPPTPTPHVPGTASPVQPFSSPILGLSLSYPADWLARETRNGVVFGTSEEVIAGGELASGAGLTIEVGPLPNAEWEDFQDLALSRASVFASEEMQISEPQPVSVQDERGALVALQGTPSLFTTKLQGFVVATAHENRSYVFVALSTAERWDAHQLDLEAIVDSVQFLPRELPSYAPDAWEPDDTPAEATELEPGSDQTHDLHTQGDRDYLRFQATRGHLYVIETLNLGPDVDTRIFLYDGEAHLLTQDDDGRALEENRASRLVWTAEKTSVHYVMVHDVGDAAAGPGTSYDIHIWEEAHFVEDEYEPDGSPRLATMLKPGEPQPHNLHRAGDVDWMRLDATAGSTYMIETFDLGDDVDTVLRLVDEEGNELAVDDEGRAEEEPRASRLRWTAHRDRTLYIVAQDAGDDSQGPGTQYWVRLVEASP